MHLHSLAPSGLVSGSVVMLDVRENAGAGGAVCMPCGARVGCLTAVDEVQGIWLSLRGR